MDTTITPFPALTRPANAMADPTLLNTLTRERQRLWQFIRRRVPDPADAEDVLQDVMSELVEAYRLPEPIEQVGAWLVRVARNRIVDRFRKKREVALPSFGDEDDDESWLEQALPAVDGDPETAWWRARLLEALTEALEELPAPLRDVFIGHEIDGRSFRTMSDETGVNLNTLLGWKRQAILHLRARLQPLYEAMPD